MVEKQDKIEREDLAVMYEVLERDESTQLAIRVIQGQRNLAAMQKIASRLEDKKESKR